jgi:hypothetical protein
MEEPLDPATARRWVDLILDGPGMTVFTRRAKEGFVAHGMTSVDAVNVLRGGHVGKGVKTASGWTYRAETRLMSVEFSFRGPNELVVLGAWRTNR